VQEFFGSSSSLQSTVVQVLWERFTGKRETSPLHRRAAVILLGMAARYGLVVLYLSTLLFKLYMSSLHLQSIPHFIYLLFKGPTACYFMEAFI
jgi:hypothetical protein